MAIGAPSPARTAPGSGREVPNDRARGEAGAPPRDAVDRGIRRRDHIGSRGAQRLVLGAQAVEHTRDPAHVGEARSPLGLVEQAANHRLVGAFDAEIGVDHFARLRRRRRRPLGGQVRSVAIEPHQDRVEERLPSAAESANRDTISNCSMTSIDVGGGNNGSVTSRGSATPPGSSRSGSRRPQRAGRRSTHPASTPSAVSPRPDS